jgi:DNA-directed RNA polymerase specialized sigma24 family protein
MNTINFKKVVPRLQAGNKAAWDELMAGFYGWSVTQVKRVVRDPERAKDVAVEFWAWLQGKGVLEYNPKKGPFYGWMAAQLRYRALDAAKQKKAPVVYYSEVSDPDSFDPTLQLSAMQDLSAIADSLKPMQKDVLAMLLDGATVQEIADDCEVSVKRARNLIGEVRRAITAQRGA